MPNKAKKQKSSKGINAIRSDIEFFNTPDISYLVV
jgi:hypothetical protein